MATETKFTHQIQAFAWRGEELELRPVCKLLDLSNSQTLDLELTLPYEFNWKLSAKKYCLGYYDETGEYQMCPNGEEIASRYERCAYCAQQDGFKQAFFYGEAPNARMEKYLAQDHYLYLAFFHPRTIKVGTASSSRHYKRLIEQDALIAMFVAKAPGTKIQQLERHISKNYAPTQSVSTRQKLAAVKLKPNSAKALEFLQQTWNFIRPRLERGEFADWLLAPSAVELVDHTANPHLYFPAVETDLTKIDSPDFIVGTFAGLRAKKLLLEEDQQVLLHDTYQLVGRKMRQAQVPRSATKPPPKELQRSLF